LVLTTRPQVATLLYLEKPLGKFLCPWCSVFEPYGERLHEQSDEARRVIVWVDRNAEADRLVAEAETAIPGRTIMTISWLSRGAARPISCRRISATALTSVLPRISDTATRLNKSHPAL
jgi:hypothetical protein